MKGLSREFSTREKVLLMIPILIILAALYYIFVHDPVSSGIKDADLQAQMMEDELVVLRARVSQVMQMQSEMKELESDSTESGYMPSYSAGKDELDFLHEILSSSTINYNVTFTELTKDGDQIRRDFNLQFAAKDYRTVKDILTKLEESKIRCLIGDLALTPIGDEGNLMKEGVQVSCTAVFYETMYGGTPDSDLPADPVQPATGE